MASAASVFPRFKPTVQRHHRNNCFTGSRARHHYIAHDSITASLSSIRSRPACRAPGIRPRHQLGRQISAPPAPAVRNDSMPGSEKEEPLVVLVTGCSEGGIGNAICKELSSRGCKVVATARSMKAMQDLQGLAASCLLLDVTNEDSIRNAVDQTLSAYGRIDMLINNAGCAAAGPVVEMDLNLFREVYEVNLLGVLAVTQAVAPHMIRRRQGRILNIGSIASWNCVPFTSAYSSSKAALESVTSALRLELRPFGLQVLYVAPGFVCSRLGDKLRGPMQYGGSFFKDDPQVPQKMYILPDGTRGPGAMPTAEFARRLSDVVLLPLGSPSFPSTWHAAQGSGFVAFARRWVPTWLLDRVNLYVSGLASMEDRLKT